VPYSGQADLNPTGASSSLANAVSRAGQAVGSAVVSGVEHAYAFPDDLHMVLPSTAGYSRSQAVDIFSGTTDCWVVGSARNSSGSDEAMLWHYIGRPQIYKQPLSQSVAPGEAAAFTVAAYSDSPCSCQWRKDNVEIQGANGWTYSITRAMTRNAGVYDCVVSNSGGSATSDAATLAVASETESTVVSAKLRKDGTTFTLDGPRVTRSFGDSFYVEDAERHAGIRIVRTVGDEPAEGSVPAIFGTIRTIGRERTIDDATVVSGEPDGTTRPLGVSSASARQPLAIGLLVRLCGITDVPVEATDTFTIDDGGRYGPVRVKLYGISLPADGVYIVVTGALGCDESGPVLRVNSSLDPAPLAADTGEPR
jgi:hypothetical protein